MKKLLVLLVFLLSPRIMWANNQLWQYSKIDSTKIIALLDEAKKEKKDINFPLYFANKFIGIPYVASTLERNKIEKLVINLQELDCTTFVENVLALTLCAQTKQYTFNQFCLFLQKIRYNNGVISYPTRLHYFSEWINDNTKQGFVKEIDIPNSSFRSQQILNLHYMSTQHHKYPMLVQNPSWIKEIRRMEQIVSGKTINYIPKGILNNSSLIKDVIKDGDIIAIVTARKGLDTSHIGFASWHNGQLHLLNASRIRGKVVDETMTLYQYMQTQKYQLGIRIIRIWDSKYIW